MKNSGSNPLLTNSFTEGTSTQNVMQICAAVKRSQKCDIT